MTSRAGNDQAPDRRRSAGWASLTLWLSRLCSCSKVKLKLQYFGHLMWRVDSLEKTLMLGKIEGRRSRGWQRMKWLDDITDSMDMSLSKLQVLVMDRKAWHAEVHWVPKGWTQLSDWTELKLNAAYIFPWCVCFIKWKLLFIIEIRKSP